MTRPIRGSGVKLTLPLVFRFLGLWLVVTIIMVLVFSVTCFLLLSNRPHGGGSLVVALAAQTVGVIVAILILAVFTTHRLAGPLIALRRTFDDVQAGDLERRLSFRRTDPHLLDLEGAFNRMMESVREQAGRKPPGLSG